MLLLETRYPTGVSDSLPTSLYSETKRRWIWLQGHFSIHARPLWNKTISIMMATIKRTNSLREGGKLSHSVDRSTELRNDHTGQQFSKDLTYFLHYLEVSISITLIPQSIMNSARINPAYILLSYILHFILLTLLVSCFRDTARHVWEMRHQDLRRLLKISVSCFPPLSPSFYFCATSKNTANSLG